MITIKQEETVPMGAPLHDHGSCHGQDGLTSVISVKQEETGTITVPLLGDYHAQDDLRSMITVKHEDTTPMSAPLHGGCHDQDAHVPPPLVPHPIHPPLPNSEIYSCRDFIPASDRQQLFEGVRVWSLPSREMKPVIAGQPPVTT